MHFDKICTWYPIFMWFWVEQVLKLTNLKKWAEQPKSCMGDENSTKNWKKNELEFIWKDFHSRSWRNKSHSIQRCISWDLIENKFLQSTKKKFVSWSLMKEKVRSLVKKCFVFWKWCEKFKFSYYENFSLFTKFDEMKKSWKLKQNPLYSRKSKVNSHSWSLLLLSKAKMSKWGSSGWKWGFI